MGRKSTDSLPANWIECRIGDITVPVEKIDPRENPDRIIAYVDISGIDNITNRIADTKTYQLSQAPSRARQVIKAGDVLFSTVRPYLRNIAAVPRQLDGEIASTGFSILRAAAGVEPAFLFYWVTSNDFVKSLSSQQYGVSYPAVKDDQVRAELMVVPPLNEQRRIVAKIEELFSELDNGVESLNAALEYVRFYGHALLRYAFEGKLTEQWRWKNSAKLETGDQFLARLQKERKASYQRQLEEWRAAVDVWEAGGAKGPKPRKPTAYKQPKEILISEAELLPRIPDSWRFVRLSEIAQVGSGMSVSATRSLEDPVDVAYLRVANVQRGSLDLSEIKHIAVEKSQLAALRLKEWDVLFNEGGDRDKLGRGWIWHNQIEPCITQNHVFRASLYMPSETSAKILSHWGNLFGRSYFEQTGKQTTNLASINKTVLSEFPVPLIPPAEQEEMRSYIDRAMTVVDAQEREIASALERVTALRQAILSAAFSGKLVEQDPNDEPASVLLERIGAEKSANNKKTRGREAA